jgi:hypothetical protein
MIDRWWLQIHPHRLPRPSSAYSQSFILLTRPFSASHSLQAKKKKMPPKKAPAAEKKVLLGRPSNNLKIGIVGMHISSLQSIRTQTLTGLPNVGKSSFFNVLSDTGEQSTPAVTYSSLKYFRFGKGCQLSLRDDQPRRSAYPRARLAF